MTWGRNRTGMAIVSAMRGVLKGAAEVARAMAIMARIP